MFSLILNQKNFLNQIAPLFLFLKLNFIKTLLNNETQNYAYDKKSKIMSIVLVLCNQNGQLDLNVCVTVLEAIVHIRFISNICHYKIILKNYYYYYYYYQTK